MKCRAGLVYKTRHRRSQKPLPAAASVLAGAVVVPTAVMPTAVMPMAVMAAGRATPARGLSIAACLHAHQHHGLGRRGFGVRRRRAGKLEGPLTIGMIKGITLGILAAHTKASKVSDRFPSHITWIPRQRQRCRRGTSIH